ncbi:MAG: hypothetical protein KC635_01075 [Myxococcales bacterium]|nr:hypothetical protein [Myxococcales bacterium]MCB9735096.1 hypothetical protein [Deltaproteobacteria bacterium]
MLRTALLSLLLVGAAASTALADVPPPPGYVEQCTVKKQQGEGEHCYSCSAWHGDYDACVKRFKDTDYTRRCKTRGASTWSEVWCHKGPEPKVPPGLGTPAPKKGDDGAPPPTPAPEPEKDDGAPPPTPAP